MRVRATFSAVYSTSSVLRKQRGELVEAAAVEAEWPGILRTARAGLLAVPSRVAARLPHLLQADVAEIGAEIRAVLNEIDGADG
jgi:phage terminase Nu1 subunit (DNA packaging protein)